jgi:hypothetical protein
MGIHEARDDTPSHGIDNVVSGIASNEFRIWANLDDPTVFYGDRSVFDYF